MGEEILYKLTPMKTLETLYLVSLLIAFFMLVWGCRRFGQVEKALLGLSFAVPLCGMTYTLGGSEKITDSMLCDLRKSEAGPDSDDQS